MFTLGADGQVKLAIRNKHTYWLDHDWSFNLSSFFQPPVARHAGFQVAGLPVVVNPLCRVAKFVLSEDFRKLQDPKLVEETQKWADEFFGMTDTVIYSTNCVYVSEQTADKLRKHHLEDGLYGRY